MLAGGAAALLAADPMSALAKTNPLAALIVQSGVAVKAVRVLTGPDGHSRFEDTTVAGERLANTELMQFLNKKAAAVAVYSAPANHKTSEAAAPAEGEILFLTHGTAAIGVHSGNRQCGAGTLVLFEDGTGTGHSMKAGPTGYTAIKIRLSA
jgi:hypothetical protein